MLTVVMNNEVSPGEVTIAVTALGPNEGGGPGTLATLHFHALAAGQSPVGMTNTLVGDYNAVEIPSNWIDDVVTVV